MLTLIQFPHSPKGLSLSPFCLKLEAYLRFAKIPYKNHFTVKLSGAPKKKLPYIELDGKKVGDSSFIIEHLSK